MKLLLYDYKDNEERVYFQKMSKEYGIEMETCENGINMDTVKLAEGFDAVSFNVSDINASILEALYKEGVRYLSTRSIGVDHIDLKRAGELGLKVSNVTYSPNSVADYAVMLILMCARKARFIMKKSEIQDFTLGGNMGRELHNLTVGVIGTGRVGKAVIKNLSGFGCKIIAYDIYESDEVHQYAEYKTLDEVFKEADVLTLHAPATEDNFHMINEDTIEEMKDNVIIVNTARGALIDTDAMIKGLESGKISAAGLDVIENEFGLYYNDLKSVALKNQELALLRSFPNVIVTPHMAFYTEQATIDRVDAVMKGLLLSESGKENPWEII